MPTDQGGSVLGELVGRRRAQRHARELEGEADRLRAQLAAQEDGTKRLRAQLAALGGLDHLALERRRSELSRQCDDLAGTIAAQRQELDHLQQDLVTTSDAALLQEIGVYEYRHPLENAEAYKAELEDLRQEIRAMVKGGHAMQTTTEWTVGGSTREGRAMVRDTAKLMLRAYNAEADNCARTLHDGTLVASEQRPGEGSADDRSARQGAGHWGVAGVPPATPSRAGPGRRLPGEEGGGAGD